MDGIRKEITTHLMELICKQEIENRADIVRELGTLGEIKRQGKNYITIIPRGMDKRLRLKGFIYEEKFQASLYREPVPTPEPGGPEFEEACAAGIADCRQRVELALAKRAEYHVGRYGKNTDAVPGTGPELESELDNSGFDFVAPDMQFRIDNVGELAAVGDDEGQSNRDQDYQHPGETGRLPDPAPWNERTIAYPEGPEPPKPDFNRNTKGELDDAYTDRDRSGPVGPNEAHAGGYGTPGPSLAEFDASVGNHNGAEEGTNRAYEGFDRTAEEIQRKYQELDCATERIRRRHERLNDKINRLRATAERLWKKIWSWVTPSSNVKPESSQPKPQPTADRPIEKTGPEKSPWYEDPFDLTPKPPGF